MRRIEGHGGMISRAEAIEIALEVIRTRGLGVGVREAMLPDEVARRPRLYGVDIESCWIVYVDDLQPFVLRSSTIVAVDRDTGRVVYHGNAHDEG